LAKYIYDSRAEEIKTAKSDWMKYLKFQQTNIFLRGTALFEKSATETKESEFEFKQYITYLPDQLT
jgi:hypothetical protein